MVGSWHKGEEGQVTSPLIVDPIAGDLSSILRKACGDSCQATGIKVSLKLRPGESMRTDAKSTEILQELGDNVCCVESRTLSDKT